MAAAFHKKGEHRSRRPESAPRAVGTHSARSRAGRIGDALRNLHKLIDMIWRDLLDSAGLPPRFWLRSWRKGFYRVSFRLYGFDEKTSTKDYMSDFQALRTLRIDSLFRYMVDNKAVFHALMLHHGCPAPELHGLIRHGRFFAFETGESHPSAEIPARLLPSGGRLVVKPLEGHHGVGFMCLSRGEHGVTVNGSCPDPVGLERLLAGLDRQIVTGFVSQGRYGTELFPKTTNTIRILTLIDPDTHEPFIARAVQRIGNSRSFPVDRFSGKRGGLNALVDIASGRLGPAAIIESRRKLAWHDRHPETGSALAGVVVPNWPEICRGILNCARRFAYMPCLAWDIVITEPGFTIIEGNSATGIVFLQVHGPLLADSRVRRFYTYHRVV